MKIAKVSLMLLIALAGLPLMAMDFKVAVKQLPMTEFYSNVITKIVEATGNTVIIQVVPPARADYLISANAVDIQVPIIIVPNAKKQNELNYDFSSVVLYKLAYVVYTNKGKAIDIGSLRNGNSDKYKIEVDPSRSDDFNFDTIPSTNLQASFKKLGDGAIDGIILSQLTGDQILISTKLNTIKRNFWAEYDQTSLSRKAPEAGISTRCSSME